MNTNKLVISNPAICLKCKDCNYGVLSEKSPISKGLVCMKVGNSGTYVSIFDDGKLRNINIIPENCNYHLEHTLNENLVEVTGVKMNGKQRKPGDLLVKYKNKEDYWISKKDMDIAKNKTKENLEKQGFVL